MHYKGDLCCHVWDTRSVLDSEIDFNKEKSQQKHSQLLLEYFCYSSKQWTQRFDPADVSFIHFTTSGSELEERDVGERLTGKIKEAG